MDFQNYQLEDFLTDESFLNYCSGKNAADIHFWENWLIKNPGKGPTVAKAKTLYSELVEELKLTRVTQQDLEDFKSLFSEHIRSPAKAEERLSTGNRFHISKSTVALVAAASIILIIAFTFFYGANEDPKKNRPLQANIPQNSIRKTMTLPDGSLVTLNPNSQITLDKDFNKKLRMVIIEGEGLFEVAEDAGRPFVVKAGDVSTTALGTSFIVRYYHHEDRVQVSLVSGKVKVERLNPAITTENAVYLTPGSQVVVDTSELLHKRPFKSEHLKEWKLNFLTFNDAEFSEIVNKLEEWYGVQVEVKNAPAVTKHFTGEFKNRNLSTVVEALSFAHNFKYQIKPDKVTIQF